MDIPDKADVDLYRGKKQLESNYRDKKLKGINSLTYSQMVEDTFPKDGAHWYTFGAKKGDVISIVVYPFPQPSIDPEGYGETLYRQRNQKPIDPQLALYAADGDKPIAKAENIRSIRGKIKDDHLVYTIQSDGTYRVCVTEKYGREVPYRIRLNLIGGPNLWHTVESDDRRLNYLGQAISNALQRLDAPIAGKECLTYRNAVGPVLHGVAIFYGLRELVANARYEAAIRSGNITRSDPLNQIVQGARQLEKRIKNDLKRFRKGEGDKPFYPVVVRIIPDLLVPFYFIFFLKARKNKKAMEILKMFKDVDPRYVQVEVAVHQHIGPGEDHSKIVQVDGRYVHIGGANLQANNNFDRIERDTAYLYMGEVAQLAMKAFDHSWYNETNYLAARRAGNDGKAATECYNFRRGQIEKYPGGRHSHPPEVLSPDWNALGLPATAYMPIFFLDKFKRPAFWSNTIEHPIAQGLLAAINTAKNEINMTAPNFNDEPVIDAIVYALARGVNVKLLLPYKRNLKKVRLPFGGGTNQSALRILRQRIACVREKVFFGQIEQLYPLLLVEVDPAKLKPLYQWGRFELRWWVYHGKKIADAPGAYHIKLMTVDGQLVYNGSTNWDGQSLNRARETSLITLNPEYAAFVNEYVFFREWERRKREARRVE